MTSHDLDALLDQLHASHEQDLEGAARALCEAAAGAPAPAQAERLARLLNHVLGEQLGDWSRAAAAHRMLCEARNATPSATQLTLRALAHFMAGDTERALAVELGALDGRPAADVLPALVTARLELASALGLASRRQASTTLFRAALTLAVRLTEPGDFDRRLAIVSNNYASALLDLGDRSPSEDELMLGAAVAARTFWLRAGTWLNHERAEYLLACVHNALGDFEAAHAAATRGLSLIATHGDEPVDRAFLELERAIAARALGHAEESRQAADTARALAEAFSDPGLREWFDRAAEWLG